MGEQSAERPETARPTPPAPAGSRPSGAGAEDISVLVVNDDPGILFALRAVLSDLDAIVVTAPSGEAALVCLLKQEFVVILMDVKMSGMDGFETARLIRTRPRCRATPIIFTTSHRATDIDRAAGYALGAADYLFMPIAPEILKAKVQVFLDAERTRRLRDRGGPGGTAALHVSPHVSPHAPPHGPGAADGADHAAPQGFAEHMLQCADAERVIVQNAGDFVALLDATGQWLYAGTSYQRYFGVPIQPATSYFDIVHPDDRDRLADMLGHMNADEPHRRLQYRVSGASERHFESDASLVCDSAGRAVQVVLVSRDISERKEMEAVVLHQSTHDALTGLPNRMLLEDRMSQATAHLERLHSTVAVLFIDLDHFKEVNDSLGHAGGDRLLQDVAERLCGCVREGDTVARLGGDEFVVMLVALHDVPDAAVVADKIIEAVSRTCHIEGSELHVTPSIGIAIFPTDGHDPDTLLRNADTAMYHAKHDGGGRFCFFAAEMQEAASRKLALTAALERAITQKEFRMHYQPKVSAATGEILGFEALIRWPLADGSWEPPSVFIPVAEETGRIERIGDWAIRESVAQLKRWCDGGASPAPVAVNVSALQLRQERASATIADALSEAGLDSSLLEVELTESAVMANPQRAVETLYRMHQHGQVISIDDFGTGYSSLAYLKRLPIDKLKIDASFVRDIATDPSDAAIVVAIITLGHVLNLTIIAEGVETEAQVCFLIAHGCDQIQGNYFSAAVSNLEAEAMLRRGPFRLPCAPPRAVP